MKPVISSTTSAGSQEFVAVGAVASDVQLSVEGLYRLKLPGAAVSPPLQ